MTLNKLEYKTNVKIKHDFMRKSCAEQDNTSFPSLWDNLKNFKETERNVFL
jgi:hypothetical protein